MSITISATSVEADGAIRIGISSKWTALDFASFFDALEKLYIYFSIGNSDITPDTYSVRDQHSLESLLNAVREQHNQKTIKRVISTLLQHEWEHGIVEYIAELAEPDSKSNLKDWYALSTLSSLLVAVLQKARTVRTGTFGEAAAQALTVRPLDQYTATFARAALVEAAGPHAVIPALNAALLDTVKPAIVRRVSFSSPGFTDIAGAGQIIGHLKDFLIELLQRKHNKSLTSAQVRKLEAEARLVEANAKEIEFKTLSSKLHELHLLGLSREQLMLIAADVDTHVAALIRLANSGQIVSVRSDVENDG